MILTGKEIIRNANDGKIVITPFDLDCVNPNSYNLHLGDKIIKYDTHGKYLDPASQIPTVTHPKLGDVWFLDPGELYLAQTAEYTETHDLVPMIEGRSSWGRLGLFIHVTAGFGDTGFKGHWTLELSAVRPLMLYPNVPICQIFYHTVQGEVTPYSSDKYQGNKGVQPSMLWKEAHLWK